MTVSTATEFGKMCRALRLARGLTQREVAERAGLATETIGTIEGSEFRVVGPERAIVLADVFGLSPDSDPRRLFLEAHERTPLSPFSAARAEYWKKKNAVRSKTRNYDWVVYAAAELAIRFIQEPPASGELCRCDLFSGGSYGDTTKPCELCFLLEKIGIIGGLGEPERTLTRLTNLMRDLEPKLFPGKKRK